MKIAYMVKDQDVGAPSVAEAASASKASETLSQFVARVLNQLSLSAWLPAAALVLLLTFVVELGEALGGGARPGGPHPVIRALRSVATISLGGALLLIVAVVVLTMVTQAFSFEAIRILEGYWGTNVAVEFVARLRCARHRRAMEALERRRDRLTADAWYGAQRKIDQVNHEAATRGKPPEVKPKVIEAVRAMVLRQLSTVRLTKAEQAAVDELLEQWPRSAPPDLIRRRVNVEKRLADFPEAHRILPTRLGNVLRRYEDQTENPAVETFVQRIYDDLPLSLKIEHDEQRTRLDLYCSMVFVVAIVTTIGTVRFALQDPRYALSAIVAGLLAASLMYRAAVATARAYGGLLMVAAEYAEEHGLAERGTDDSPDRSTASADNLPHETKGVL